MRNRSTSNASEESFKYVNILDLHWYVLGFSAMVVGDRLQENAFHWFFFRKDTFCSRQ